MNDANSITAQLLDRIPQQFPQVRVWRNNRVKAMAIGKGGKMRMINAGVDGQADISGIAGPHGRRVEIEVKAGKDELSIDQIRFAHMIKSHGGVYLVAREVEETLTALGEAIYGE